ncbi:hypothetical protein AMTRI_Chr11g99420 [Amborella trichopoda]|uniref:Uncharacterized protein n=1 Tax=Amborella trichopoda TaxID=13333 RepID=W1PNK6_AMBTC|nr:tetratricopeptide repeat protein 33 [Amborella trichopoda]ERN08740.1 hypothetical protein AMTR_s00017p00242470 [Amborella trichopoda]|eukprot:XP_006847159.1 tetratricopeptide repeat protein 33 [Amborella trichopoda]
MQLVWKKSGKRRRPLEPCPSDLPFRKNEEEEERPPSLSSSSSSPVCRDTDDDHLRIANFYQSQGDKLAEIGRYREALGKWESSLTIMPERAVLHEQKAQVLLELGEAWKALRAATRATELEPSWAEAWITLGRAQLNFGEPEASLKSFDRALEIKPDSEEVKNDIDTAVQLIRKRKRLQTSGMNVGEGRYTVRDKTDIPGSYCQG